MEKTKLVIYLRKDKDGNKDVVYFDGNEITTYSLVGQHSSACKDWLYCSTKPVDESKCESLLKEFKSIYHEYEVVVRKRLPNYFKTEVIS